MSELEIFLWLTQAPNTSMQISRNKEATKRASPKNGSRQCFLTFWQIGHFLPKIGGTTKSNYKP